MKNAKKLLSFLIIGVVVCTHAYNDYQTCHATEAVVAGGLASAGAALLGLGALCGVGMTLEDDKQFHELSDNDKKLIEDGLAVDFRDIAQQRGASLDDIKKWTTDLCNGVLDKSSECWGIFKDWIKNVELSDDESRDLSTIPAGQLKIADLLPFTCNFEGNGFSNPTPVLHRSDFGSASEDGWWDETFDAVMISASKKKSYLGFCQVRLYGYKRKPYGYDYYSMSINYDNFGFFNPQTFNSAQSPNTYISPNITDNTVKFYGNNNLSAMIDNNLVNEYGLENNIYFTTNTDYLEKLKGQDEDVIDVIDVTDIKNPIIESRPNSLARIDWNRGTRRTNNNNDDDDNKMVTGLVPMDVWYEQIDDEQEDMRNAVVVYDDYIQNHPEEKDTYFISTAPVTNINNYFNTLPVVNIPATGTIVNNNYEYNNYNNNNVTIYQEPYSAGIIPTFPDFSKKFPFCIPFDLYEFFVVFLAEKEAPKIEVPFPVLDNTNHQLTVEHITIDLSGYEYLSDVLRVMLFVLFCVGLMILTRQLIKG